MYFNIYYLVPAFLNRNNLLTYLLLFVTAALVLTPLRSVVFYFRFMGDAEMQFEVLNSQIFTFTSFMIIGVFSTIIQIVSHWISGQRKMKELEKENLQSELKFLRSQINPHFLFNTLNSLYSLTLSKSDLAPEIVIRLSEIMRYMLYECNEKLVPLEREIKFMKNYVELEKLRYGDDVNIDFCIEGEVEDQKIAPLLFIPFFENSFKHGLSNRTGKDWIVIQFYAGGDQVKLTIRNSIPKTVSLNNYSEQSNEKEILNSSGIGLENVKRRLELLYSNHYELEISKGDDQFEIYLSIKL